MVFVSFGTDHRATNGRSSAASLRRPGLTWRRCIGLSRFRIQEPRAGAQDPAIRPVLFVEEDFSLTGVTVIPARDQPQMLAEFPGKVGRRGLDTCGSC